MRPTKAVEVPDFFVMKTPVGKQTAHGVGAEPDDEVGPAYPRPGDPSAHIRRSATIADTIPTAGLELCTGSWFLIAGELDEADTPPPPCY